MKKLLAVLLLLVCISLMGCMQAQLKADAGKYCEDKNAAAVYVCGDYVRVVSTLTGKGSTIYKADGTELNCPVVALKHMSVECKEVVVAPDCKEIQIC